MNVSDRIFALGEKGLSPFPLNLSLPSIPFRRRQEKCHSTEFKWIYHQFILHSFFVASADSN